MLLSSVLSNHITNSAINLQHPTTLPSNLIYHPIFTMSIPESGNTLIIPAYNAESEMAVQELQWSQSFRTRTARYYIVRATNQSKGNVDVLLYIQDRFYKDEGSSDYIGKIPGARKEGSESQIANQLKECF